MSYNFTKTLSKAYRAFRDSIRDIITNFLFNRARPTQHIQPENIYKILFFRIDGKIGDTLISNLIYREIKHHRPDINVHVLASSGNKNLLENNSHIDKVLCCANPRKINHLFSSLKDVQNEHYDIVVHLSHKLKPRELIFLRYSHAKQIWCSDRNLVFADAYHMPEKNEWHFSECCAHVLQTLGIRHFDKHYPIAINPDSKEKVNDHINRAQLIPFIVFNPYGATANRQILADRAIELAKMILKTCKNTPVFIVYPPSKKTDIEYIAYKMSEKNIHILPWQTSLDDAFALIEQAALVISVDTSLVHVATALGKPLVGIYEADKTNFALWHPNNTQSSVVRSLAWENAYTRRNIGEFNDQDFISALEERFEQLSL